MSRRVWWDQWNDVGGARESDDADSVGFECFTTAFFAVHERQYAEDCPTGCANSVDGLARRSAGRDRILDHHHLIAGGERAFDQFSSPVSLRLFAHGKGADGDGGRGARVRDRARNRVRAQGEAADRVSRPADIANRLEPKRPDECEAFGAHRRRARVDV